MILNAMKPRSEITETKNELPEKERCDRCGFSPFVKAVRGKSVLMFCLHHGRENVPTLVDNGWEIEDNTAVLVKDFKPAIDETPLEVSKPVNGDGGSGVLAKAI